MAVPSPSKVGFSAAGLARMARQLCRQLPRRAIAGVARNDSPIGLARVALRRTVPDR
jgi:hypothetical protein